MRPDVETDPDRLRASYERALHWLTESGIRSEDGAYASTYDSERRAYRCWYGHETCLCSTSGAVLVLAGAGRDDLAIRSAEHLASLAVPDGERYAAALLAGRGADTILTNWVMSAIPALLRAAELEGSDRFVEVALRAGRSVVTHAQEPDGSLVQQLRLDGRRFVDRRLRPREVWGANCVRPLRELARISGDTTLAEAADRFTRWLLRQQRPSGSFPMYRHSAASRVAYAIGNRDPGELLRGCRKGHPTSHSHAIDALALCGHAAEARRAASWLSGKVGPNGLCYQFYYAGGGRSPEEDTMPTAHFGLVALAHPDLGVSPEVLAHIASGVAYAQFASDDRNADGGMRGVPLHPKLGEHAYCWDTAHGALYLRAYLEGI